MVSPSQNEFFLNGFFHNRAERCRRIWRSRSGDGGRVNANALDQKQVSNEVKFKIFFPYSPRTATHYSAYVRQYKMRPKRKRPSTGGRGNIFPSAGEETTNHSKGKPESEWPISSVPGGEFPWARPRANGTALSAHCSA